MVVGDVFGSMGVMVAGAGFGIADVFSQVVGGMQRRFSEDKIVF